MSLRQHITLNKERIRWRTGFTERQITTFPFIIPLTSGPSTTNPAQTSAGTAVPWEVTMTTEPQAINTLRSKVVVNSQWLDLSVTGGNEASPLYMTAFIVQLQPKSALQTYYETSNMTVLAKDSDYCCPDTVVPGVASGYGAYLNSSRFKIIKRMEFCTVGPTIGWPGGPPAVSQNTQGLGAALRRSQHKLSYGNTVLKSTGKQADSQDLEYGEIEAKHKRFIIIFSDNSVVDNEYPNVALSSLITGYAAE